MLETTTQPARSVPSFAEAYARNMGYKFEAEQTGRVQLVSPAGERCGSFADIKTAALTAVSNSRAITAQNPSSQ